MIKFHSLGLSGEGFGFIYLYLLLLFTPLIHFLYSAPLWRFLPPVVTAMIYAIFPR
jgi:hypothetical protein